MMKIRLNRFHIKLEAVLLAVFAAIILIEFFMLYLALYRDSQSQAPGLAPKEPVLRIDFTASEKAKAWFSDHQNFEIEAYELTSGDAGRENPFAEY